MPEIAYRAVSDETMNLLLPNGGVATYCGLGFSHRLSSGVRHAERQHVIVAHGPARWIASAVSPVSCASLAAVRLLGRETPFSRL